ncbi:hypothetical protein [Hyalangium minutum]|uniref:Uncharacterized protein n=1 Tax=Hyalangium minutum TaxID=394096 RepID=A0A085WEU0_9BACT|nr:hypothetical protein [Hyalangium minutum]KFE66203.1 hypothetical protein DB31_1268 [Hyalangium minutum]
MSAALGVAWQRLRRSYGLLLLSAAMLVSGCTPVQSNAPPMFFQRYVQAPEVRFRVPARRASRAAPPRAVRAWDCPRPEGWPAQASSDEELLAPLLACGSAAGFLALQREVDMARLLERLGDWSAVRLGALGPLRDSRAAEVLARKRASFLLTTTADHGAYAQVFALFLLHSACDDEVGQVLGLLARDKQLSQALGALPAVRQELERRGLPLSAYPERGEQARDVLRGLGSAGRDALNSTPTSDGARYLRMSAQARQLPPAYQQALSQLEQALISQHYAPENMALGSFDTLTFGVPLGFYSLAAGTAHGLEALEEGHYEQATRELAPAALLVALYATGKGTRYLAPAEGSAVHLRLPELRLEALRHVAWQLMERLGLDGVAEVARYVRASREAAVFVTAGGEPAAVALYEARGNVARAQATLSKALPEGTGAAEPRPPASGALGGLASLVDEAAGHTREVVEAKLLQAEWEAQGPRLPADAALLRKLEATLDTPPPGVPEGYVLWNDYLAYRRARLALLEEGKSARGPLRWEPYERMRGAFARGLTFERTMISLLRADAALPPAQRRWLSAFTQPRIEVHVGLSKHGVPGVRFADVLVIEHQPPPGQTPRVETFSFKSRNLQPLTGESLEASIRMDASAALEYYGGTVDILRPSLKRRVEVNHIRLVYERGSLMPKQNVLNAAVRKVKQQVSEVEVVFQ